MSTDAEIVTRAADAYLEGSQPADARGAVKAALRLLASAAPGRSVEIRIPPYAAIQAVPGTTHRRGTPSAVVEADARTWILLVTGRLDWAQAIDQGLVQASGERSDLRDWLPVPEFREAPA